MAEDTAAQADPLPSWNDGDVKRSILTFVQSVTNQYGPDYVPPPARIAVFDNDGTLWSEQPLYIQLAFALDRVKTLAPQHPEWRTTQPFQAVIENDQKALSAAGVKGLIQLVVATHMGMTTDEFERIAKTGSRAPGIRASTDRTRRWLSFPWWSSSVTSGATDSRPTSSLAAGSSSCGVIAEQLYGIPPEQVIGSSGKFQYEVRDGTPVIVRLPEIEYFDDKEAKPAAIQKFIGRRPIAAFGNSDGDLQMLQWTAGGAGRRLMVYVDHTDGKREVEYRVSLMGRFEVGLEEARERGWTVVSMKDDWKRVFSFE